MQLRAMVVWLWLTEVCEAGGDKGLFDAVVLAGGAGYSSTWLSSGGKQLLAQVCAAAACLRAGQLLLSLIPDLPLL